MSPKGGRLVDRNDATPSPTERATRTPPRPVGRVPSSHPPSPPAPRHRWRTPPQAETMKPIGPTTGAQGVDRHSGQQLDNHQRAAARNSFSPPRARPGPQPSSANLGVERLPNAQAQPNGTIGRPCGDCVGVTDRMFRTVTTSRPVRAAIRCTGSPARRAARIAAARSRRAVCKACCAAMTAAAATSRLRRHPR